MGSTHNTRRCTNTEEGEKGKKTVTVQSIESCDLQGGL